MTHLEPLPNVIYVVSFHLDQAVPNARHVLDDGELDRAARLAFARDRRRFVAAHALTRQVLGSYLRCSPAALRFQAGVNGKPRIANANIDARFNLSHAGERALLALTLGREVGVDIEEHRPIDISDLATRVFATSETDALNDLPASEQREAFFRCWTRKEAFIKALGKGLSLPLDGFVVGVTTDQSPQLVAFPTNPGAARRWQITSLSVERGYSAALAVEAGEWHVVQLNANCA